MRRAARVDANQDQIVSALRGAGASVWIITDSKKRLTKLQADFFENWSGSTLARIDCPEAALRMIGVVK
jgi:hypothetical protein